MTHLKLHFLKTTKLVLLIVRTFCLFAYLHKQKVRTTIAEALSRLDMSGAVRDVRRFNYVSKVSCYFYFGVCDNLKLK